MSSASSQTDKELTFQDLVKKWSEVEKKLSTLLNHRIDGNSLSICTQFSDKLSSIIQLFLQVSKSFNCEDLSCSDETFVEKMRGFVIENSNILKDSSFYQIRDIIGQNLQLSSYVLMKFYCFSSMIGLILKCECSLKTMNSEEIKNFHIFALNYLMHLLIDKNFFHLSFFNLLDESFHQSNSPPINHNKLLIKLYKYSLLKALLYHEDESLLELCEIFLFKILKENEHLKCLPEFILDLFQCFFKLMSQKYLLDLYNIIRQADFPIDFLNNIDKIFFLNCGEENRRIIFEEVKLKKFEKSCDFFEVLKPLFFKIDLDRMRSKLQQLSR